MSTLGGLRKGSFLRSRWHMVRLSIFEETAAVKSICQQIGFGQVVPTLLKAAHHTSLLIAPYKMVARVQSGESIATAAERAGREIAVTRHLADRGGPTLGPLREFAGPHVRAPAVVTFWPFAENRRAATEPDATVAAISLATVHQMLREFDGSLPPYTENLDRCWAALSDDSLATDTSAADRHLLKAEFRRLRRLVEEIGVSWVPVHGDSHLGNLLLDDEGGDPLWLDFEDACLGPREYDIANLPAEAWPIFADADPRLINAYALLKSVCVAVWCLKEPHRNAEMQEAADYHLNVVRDFAR